MKRFQLLLLIFSIPFIIVVIVNETSLTPTNNSNSLLCTRACHNKGCIHFNEKLEDKNNQTFVTQNFSTYRKNIEWLKNNPFGFSYVQINLLLYVVISPILSIYLLWKLIKPKR